MLLYRYLYALAEVINNFYYNTIINVFKEHSDFLFYLFPILLNRFGLYYFLSSI